MPQRELYIDRLRTAMTVLVIYCHAAMTYGGNGKWFYREIAPSARPTSILFTLFIATSQAYLMGFFFLLSGYFTPGSLNRKGPARFLLDRFLRLAIPLLVFGFFLGPLTATLAAKAQGHGMRGTLIFLLRNGSFINGPLWFAEALLIFCVAYCLWRSVAAHWTRSAPAPKRASLPIPSPRAWLISAFGVGLGALVLRSWFPLEARFLGLWIGDFSSYIFLFALGVVAWRSNWLSQLTWQQARPWVIAACIAWPILPIGFLLSGLADGKTATLGAFSWPVVLLDFWEPVLAWGLISGLLVFFRSRFNHPSASWTWLGRRAYAAYILHAPVLVGVSVLAHNWQAPAMLKFGVIGTLGCALTWLAADPFVRIPGIRRIV